jgi:hypothetical protein
MVPDAFGPEVAAPHLYYDRLGAVLAATDAGYLVAGEVDLRDRPRSLLAERPPVGWLEAAGGRGGVRVWKVVDAPGLRARFRTTAGSAAH